MATTEFDRLAVLIEANTKAYERSMERLVQKTEKAMRSAQKSISGLSKTLNAADLAARRFIGVWSVTRVATAVRGIVKELADLQDAGERIGIGTDRLQQLQHQAVLAGSSIEAMTDALQTFARRLSQARHGQGELSDLFGAQTTPIDPKAFTSTEQALDAFIDLIGHGADEMARLEIAAIGFGRANADLALTFAGGSAAAKAHADQMNRLYTPEQLAAAAKFDDDLANIVQKLSVNIKGGIVDYLVQLQKEMRSVKSFSSTLFSGGGFYITGGSGPGGAAPKQDMAATEAGDRVAAAFADGFRNNKDLEAALQKKLSIAGGEDYTVLPPDPERISEATGELREQLQERYRLIKIRKDETQAIADQIAELEREHSLIGATNTEIRISNELHEAGAYATEADKNAIIGYVTAIEEEQAALDKMIATLDGIRDAAGSALDSFVQSLVDAKGPLEALKAGLVDILQSIIRIAEQQAIARLFGVAGTAGAGILSGLPGIGSVAPAAAAAPASTSVHITAEPSPLLNLTITKSSQAAEERAIARGPVVARNNQMRYGIA